MNLNTYIRAGYTCVLIQTNEEARAEGVIQEVAQKLGLSLFGWSITDGVINYEDGSTNPEAADPVAMVEHFNSNLPARSLLIVRDLHPFLGGPGNPGNPMLIRRLKDAIRRAARPECFKAMVMIGCQLVIPPEIEKLVVVDEFELPDRPTLNTVLDGIATSAKLEIEPPVREKILDAARGLTTTEAANAFSLSFVQHRRILPDVVHKEKTQAVKRNGLLEIVDRGIHIEDIGGLENLKADLLSKRHLFTKEARDYGLKSPRGILCVGQAGTGKSLTAQAAGSIFGVPLLKLEAGMVFGSLVGQSEANWRSVFATAKAVAPCILWVNN